VFHGPSIGQIFKFLERPINAVEGLNVKFSGYYIINFCSYSQVYMLVFKIVYATTVCLIHGGHCGET
jgi:hypothetical protein